LDAGVRLLVMTSDPNDDLFPMTRNPPGTQFINERCLIRTQDECRVVLLSGIPLAQYAVGDRMSEAHAPVPHSQPSCLVSAMAEKPVACAPPTREENVAWL
jgi:hypothetical protein